MFKLDEIYAILMIVAGSCMLVMLGFLGIGLTWGQGMWVYSKLGNLGTRIFYSIISVLIIILGVLALLEKIWTN